MMGRTLFAGLLALALAAQTVVFQPVQPELFGAGETLVNAWADFDGDGDLDEFVGFDGKPNRLYRNTKGTFADAAAEAGVADVRSTRAAAWGDFDADGDPDLLLGFTPKPDSVLRLYRNDKGKFTDATAAAGLTVMTGAVRQPVWVDVDADGDLDLFVAFRDKANVLYRNDKGAFTDIAPQVGLADTRRTVGAVWFDLDEDRDLDLALGNMDGDANALYRNDGGKFVDIAAAAEANGLQWGNRTPNDKTNGTVRPCAGDVDKDGRPDLFMANYGKNGLFLNQGGGRFENASAAWGVDIDGRYDTCAFGDMDNDGWVDLYVNGTVTGGVSYPDYLFRNTGTRFQDVTSSELKALHADHGAYWVDFDRDGDLDLSLTGVQANGMHLLLRNPLPAPAASRSLQIRVVDEQGRRVPGVTILVLAAGSTQLVATGLVDAGSGYDAQSDMPVHVGLETMAPVDIQIRSPRAVDRHLFRKIDPRQYQGKVFEARLTMK